MLLRHDLKNEGMQKPSPIRRNTFLYEGSVRKVCLCAVLRLFCQLPVTSNIFFLIKPSSILPAFQMHVYTLPLSIVTCCSTFVA